MQLRAYKDGDEKQIIALDSKLAADRWNLRNLDNWYWKFTSQNPSGKSFIWVIEDNNRLIAHFAAVPYRLKVFNEEFTVSHSIGALVEERYQNRGLMKFTGDKLFDELARNNIPFTYGFPNKRSYLLHKRYMGYTDLIEFDEWKIGKDTIDKKINDYKELSDFRKIREFDEKADNLWELCRSKYKVIVVRNKDYLNWRYIKRPDREYYSFGLYDGNQLKGYTVLKLYQTDKFLRGHILDIFADYDDRDTFSKLVEGSLGFFRDQKVDEITCWIWGNKLIEGLLAQNGFFQRGVKIPLVIRNNTGFQYGEDIKNNNCWYFTMGDSTEIF
jgi:hypothetical protein